MVLAHVRASRPVMYHDWTSREEEPEMAWQFEHGRKDEPRAIGGDTFIAAVTGHTAPVRPEMMLDDVIACVARHQGVALRSALSPLRIPVMPAGCSSKA
jgi:hypothetical protein